MYVIIGSHCVPHDGMFLRVTLNVIVRQMPLNVLGVSIAQKLVVKLSNTSAISWRVHVNF